jgi:hypothetical protein
VGAHNGINVLTRKKIPEAFSLPWKDTARRLAPEGRRRVLLKDLTILIP